MLDKTQFRYRRSDFGPLDVSLKHLDIEVSFEGETVRARNRLRMEACNDLSRITLDACNLSWRSNSSKTIQARKPHPL